MDRRKKKYFKHGSKEEVTRYAIFKAKKCKLDAIVMDDQQMSNLNDTENLEVVSNDDFARVSIDENQCTLEHSDESETEATFANYNNDSDDLRNSSEEEYYLPNDLFSDDDNCLNEEEMKKIPRSLKDLLNNPDFFDIIKIPINVSLDELVFMLLKFGRINKLPLTTVSNLFSLVNAMFIKPILPASRYMINKFFNDMENTLFHATCSVCSKYLGNMDDLQKQVICDICNANVSLKNPSCENFFAIINPSTAIADILGANGDYYNNVVMERVHEPNHIKDIYDGELYRQFVSALPQENRYCYVTAVFNSDGVAPFQSPLSVWPIFLMLNELPPQERFNNVIPCALWFNKNKPNMSVFLDVFVDTMNELCETGIECLINGKKRILKLYVLLSCVDSVARAPMQGLTQFNGKYGCNWCLHPTVWTGTSTKYPFLDSVPEHRTKEGVEEHMEQLSANLMSQSIFGVKSVSPLINLKCFDIVNSFVPDYMHCILAGVGKQITEYLLLSDDLEFYQNLINQIKVPHQVCRLTRPLSFKAYWKCKEWENWILYYSVPLLSTRKNQTSLSYWSLLVESLHILLQTNITYLQLNKADQMLREFVCKTEEFFSIEAMTFNVHQLLHICESVKNLGPLWAHSAFAFESGNHHLLQAIKSGKGVILQILTSININRSISTLEKYIFSCESNVAKKYCTDVLSRKVNKFIKVSSATYFGKGRTVPTNIKIKFQLPHTCKAYLRMVKENTLYTSCLKSNRRSDNSSALLCNGRFIRIVEFIVDSQTRTEVTLCRSISVSERNVAGNCTYIKRICQIDTENLLMIPTSEIKSICVLVDLKNVKYLCILPNLYYY